MQLCNNNLLDAGNKATDKNIKDFVESGHIIFNAVNDFYSGKLFNYKIVSTELRKLLCDSQSGKDISLFGKLFPNLELRPLSDYKAPPEVLRGLKFSVPLYIKRSGDGRIRTRLSINMNYFVTRDEWLNQWILTPSMPLRKFIKSIADKEGAHSDDELDDYIKALSFVKIGAEESYKYVLISLGEYILFVIDGCVNNNNWNHLK